jgi:hypothetical protein
VLTRRGLQGKDSRFAAIEAVGGLFVVPPEADPALVRRAVLEDGIRALEVQARDLDFLTQLPLEFLSLNVALPRIEPVNSLGRLRGLVLDAWTGDLDFTALPDLEWFGATKVERGQLDGLFEQGHERLHHLGIGKYRETDLSPLSDLTALTHLSVGDSRALARVTGIDALPRLRHFDVYSCRALATLSGIEAATSLQHVELSRCNGIDRLEDVAALPDLRSLHIEMDRPPPLAALVGHPTLEYVWVVSARKPAAEEVSRLLENPPLRFLAAARAVWMRGNKGWLHVPDIYAMTDDEAAVHERHMRERDAFAVW